MKICVYCSSSNHIPKKYFQQAQELGLWLAQKQHSIIYGGANVGLMEELAHSFRLHNGHSDIIGIIPKKIINMGLTTTEATQIIEVEDMKERKELMRNMGDAFIALPGSFGTLDEIIEEIVLKQLNYHNKPIIFYDPDNFYEHLYLQIDRFFEEKFLAPEKRGLFEQISNTSDLAQILNTSDNLI